MARSTDVDTWLDTLDAEAREPIASLRALLFDVAPDAIEEFKWSRPCYRTAAPFAYLASFKKHVTIGFNEGSRLDDPDGLLEGTGKGMRHVKVPLGTEIPSGVRALVQQAAAG